MKVTVIDRLLDACNRASRAETQTEFHLKTVAGLQEQIKALQQENANLRRDRDHYSERNARAEKMLQDRERLALPVWKAADQLREKVGAIIKANPKAAWGAIKIAADELAKAMTAEAGVACGFDDIPF